MPRRKETLGIELGLDVLCYVATRFGYRGLTFSTPEIADVCGCSRKTVRNIERAALAKLFKRINEREHSI